MPPADDIEDIDPGLAGERTHLAWTRTAIAYAALGAAILKNSPVAGVPILALSVVVWALGRLPRAPGTRHARAWRLLLVTAIVTGIALVALITSFLSSGSGGLLIKHQ